MVTESVLLAAVGSAGALLLTYWSRSVSRTVLADSVPYAESIGIDWWVLSFNVAIAAATGVLCGLASLPAAIRISPAAAFKGGDAPAQRRYPKIRAALLSTEVAMTFILVVAAGLLVQTLWNLTREQRGFNSERLLTIRVAPGGSSVSGRATLGMDRTYLAEFFVGLTERLGQLPGVLSVAAVSNIPLGGVSMGLSRLAVDGQAAASVERGTFATYVASVTPGYFRTLGTPVLAGRDFTTNDRLGAGPVAIVNDAFRRRFAAGENVIGSRITYDKRAVTVVRLVADVPDRTLRDTARPLIFVPLTQAAAGPFGWNRLTLVVRTRVPDPHSVASLVRGEIWTVDRNIVIDELSSMDDRVAGALRSERRSAWLFGLFAVAALSIAAMGVYGVASYATSQRTREIGIRAALGADRRALSRLVVFQTLGSIAVGIAAGAAGAVAATRLIASQLYGVAALDAITFLGAAIALVGVALAASYLPARRAMAVDPVAALRAD